MDVDRILRRQHGVISYGQALAAGLTKDAIRWRVARGDWVRVRRGVYRVAAWPTTWHGRAHALAQVISPGGALTLEAAAHLHGVSSRQPQVITAAVVGREVQRLPGTRIATRRRLQIVTRDHLPVTDAVGTVLDLADVPGATWRDAVHVAARWVSRRKVTVPDVLMGLDRRLRHQHRAVITTALEPIAAGAESILEVGAVDRVILPHGLPMPELQVVDGPEGGRVRRDAEWREYGVVLELDGLLGHDGESLFADRSRDRRAATTGRLTLRGGHVEVQFAPCELAADIFLTLRSRGFLGWPVRCAPGCVIGRVLAVS